MRITPRELIKSIPEESWLNSWLESWPTVEMPWSYLLFGSLSVLGAAIGRKCWFQDDYRRLWPMLNLLLIGPSGIGKSSAIELNQTLLAQLPIEDRPQFIIGSASPEKLHDDLVIQPHAIVYASELANFFGRQKYMEGMIPYVTELLDCRPLERRTKSGNIQRIESPETTIIGGSTPEWLQEALPDNAVGGGFLPRFMIVKEDERRQRVPNPASAISRKEWTKALDLRDYAYAEFQKLIAVANGPSGFRDLGVVDEYSRWYLSHVPPNTHLAPFAARAPEMVKRIAMLIAITCYRHEITEEDLHAAIQMYLYAEAKLAEVVIPKSQQGKMLALIQASIPHFGANMEEIFHAVKSFLPASDAEKYLISLQRSGDVAFREGKFYPRSHN